MIMSQSSRRGQSTLYAFLVLGLFVASLNVIPQVSAITSSLRATDSNINETTTENIVPPTLGPFILSTSTKSSRRGELTSSSSSKAIQDPDPTHSEPERQQPGLELEPQNPTNGNGRKIKRIRKVKLPIIKSQNEPDPPGSTQEVSETSPSTTDPGSGSGSGNYDIIKVNDPPKKEPFAGSPPDTLLPEVSVDGYGLNKGSRAHYGGDPYYYHYPTGQSGNELHLGGPISYSQRDPNPTAHKMKFPPSVHSVIEAIRAKPSSHAHSQTILNNNEVPHPHYESEFGTGGQGHGHGEPFLVKSTSIRDLENSGYGNYDHVIAAPKYLPHLNSEPHGHHEQHHHEPQGELHFSHSIRGHGEPSHTHSHHGFIGPAIGKALKVVIPSAIFLTGVSALFPNRLRVPTNDPGPFNRPKRSVPYRTDDNDGDEYQVQYQQVLEEPNFEVIPSIYLEREHRANDDGDGNGFPLTYNDFHELLKYQPETGEGSFLGSGPFKQSSPIITAEPPPPITLNPATHASTITEDQTPITLTPETLPPTPPPPPSPSTTENTTPPQQFHREKKPNTLSPLAKAIPQFTPFSASFNTPTENQQKGTQIDSVPPKLKKVKSSYDAFKFGKEALDNENNNDPKFPDGLFPTWSPISSFLIPESKSLRDFGGGGGYGGPISGGYSSGPGPLNNDNDQERQTATLSPEGNKEPGDIVVVRPIESMTSDELLLNPELDTRTKGLMKEKIKEASALVVSEENATTKYDLSQDGPVLGLLNNVVEHSGESGSCQKRALCELAIRGSSNNATKFESFMWSLATLVPDAFTGMYDLTDVFHSIRQRSCVKFECDNPNLDIQE